MRLMLLQAYGGVELEGCVPMTEWDPEDVKAHIEFQHTLNAELLAPVEQLGVQGVLELDVCLDVLGVPLGHGDAALELDASVGLQQHESHGFILYLWWALPAALIPRSKPSRSSRHPSRRTSLSAAGRRSRPGLLRRVFRSVLGCASNPLTSTDA